MSFNVWRVRLSGSAVLVAGLLGSASALPAPAWIEGAGGCKVESLDPRPKESFDWTGACVDGYADGPGVLSWTEDGQPAWTYRGRLKAGRAMGEGRLEFARGDVYEGSFVDGRRTGQGSYVTSYGRYSGGFVDGVFSGRGHFNGHDGLDYQGELQAGRWHGEGVMRWFSGEVLKAQWKNGVAQSGEIARANGDNCRGGFQIGQLSGPGRCVWANGDAYEGGLLAGALDGDGDYRFRDGRRYQGAFKRGLPSGTGTLSRGGAVVYRGGFAGGTPDQVEGLIFSDRPQPSADEATALLAGLRFDYAAPVQVPLTPIAGLKICTKMGTPKLPKVESPWHGEAVFEAVVTVKGDRIVSYEIRSLTAGVDRTLSRAIHASIGTALQETYECHGNVVFALQFAFRV